MLPSRMLKDGKWGRKSFPTKKHMKTLELMANPLILPRFDNSELELLAQIKDAGPFTRSLATFSYRAPAYFCPGLQ